VPWCFLVADLPLIATETLIAQQYWLTPTITFFAIPFSPSISTFACTIENLTYDESEANNVRQLIKSTIRNCDEAVMHVNQDNTDPAALNAIINSTHVAPLKLGIPAKLGKGTKLVWNVYIDPPSKTPNRHRNWKKILKSLTFFTPLNGVGVAQTQLAGCTGCKSTDHPRGTVCAPSPMLQEPSTTTYLPPKSQPPSKT
jgi:hypothetical protein